ncbi:MAG: hypothetical protein ABFS32_18685 [Bacteroidota bacterium]
MQSKRTRFWPELKRRKVLRALAMYAATAFIIMEAADIMLPRFGLPEWTVTMIIIILIIGLPITVVLSWIFDLTPEGLKRTESAIVLQEDRTENSQGRRRLRLSDITIAILVVIVIMLAYPRIFTQSRYSYYRNWITTDLPLKKTLAVLPFVNWNSDEAFAHMGDAVANEIITQLSKIKKFRVSSYTSSSHYKGADVPLRSSLGGQVKGFTFTQKIEGSSNEDLSAKTTFSAALWASI